jgi:hypothetical protein
MSKLKWAAIGVGVATVWLLAFGYWGLYTEGGRSEYRELAGIGPMMALFAGMGGLWLLGTIWSGTMVYRKQFRLQEFLAFITYWAIVCCITVSQWEIVVGVPLFFLG